VGAGGLAAVPARARQVDATRGATVGWVGGGGADIRAARLLCGRVLLSVVRFGNIHPQPSDRVPLPSGGPRDS